MRWYITSHQVHSVFDTETKKKSLIHVRVSQELLKSPIHNLKYQETINPYILGYTGSIKWRFSFFRTPQRLDKLSTRQSSNFPNPGYHTPPQFGAQHKPCIIVNTATTIIGSPQKERQKDSTQIRFHHCIIGNGQIDNDTSHSATRKKKKKIFSTNKCHFSKHSV